MSLELIIDTREDKLIRAMRSPELHKECGHVVFQTTNLDIGDLVFRLPSGIVCLLERKTIEDYVASIADGRAKNQALRINQLKQTIPELLVIYLIEGKPVAKDQRFRSG